MADSKKNVFFIGGYSYTVDKSTPLCRREDFFHSATLYQSPNGRFFVVENDAADTITVKSFQSLMRKLSWMNTPPGFSLKTISVSLGSQNKDSPSYTKSVPKVHRFRQTERDCYLDTKHCGRTYQ